MTANDLIRRNRANWAKVFSANDPAGQQDPAYFIVAHLAFHESRPA